MGRFLLISILLLSCGGAAAQHDLYRWQLSGYTGMANYFNQDNSTVNYFEIENNLLHRLELTRNLGYGFGLSVSSSFGGVRGFNQQRSAFNTDVRMAGVRAYFYADNGFLLNNSSWVAPYLFGGYGLGIFETPNGATTDESRYVPAIPFGAGLKFRLAERWQLSVQTEVVYLTEPHLQAPALEQNDNIFWHTGLTLGYSFGFRKSTFRAPRLYADNVAMLQSVEGLYAPRQNVLEAVLKLEPKSIQLESIGDSVSLEQLARTDRTLASPADTLSIRRSGIGRDSSLLAPANVTQVTPVQPVRPVPKAPQASQPVPAAAQAQSAETVTIDTIVVVRTVRRPASATQERARAATVAPKQTAANVRTDTAVARQPEPVNRSTEARRTEAVNQADTARQAVAVDRSNAVRQPANVRQTDGARQQQQLNDRTRQAPATTEPVPAQREGTDRIVERQVYVPIDNGREPARRNDANMALVQEERLRLESANAENRRLQSRVDSLQAVQRTDTSAATKTEVAVDSSLVRYLQQQAALNDSMLLRLNRYERELAQIKSMATAPESTPTPEAPKSYSATVFYPVNSHAVPAEGLQDLQEALKVLRNNPAWKARLTGYTDQSGNAAYNMALSKKRVEGLVEFLTKQGIARDRISTDYVGDTKSSQKLNPLDRKVEIRIEE